MRFLINARCSLVNASLLFGLPIPFQSPRSSDIAGLIGWQASTPHHPTHTIAIDRGLTAWCPRVIRFGVAELSNGSSMAFRVGVVLADRVAAVAPHSGTCWSESLPPSIDVSVCYLTGTADTLNPIEGGFPRLAFGSKDEGGRSRPAWMEMINKWVKALDCDEVPSDQELTSGVHSSRFGPGSDAAEVVCITIEGLGHHWAGGKSQAPEFLVGQNTEKLKATDIIWEFFEKHPASVSPVP